GLSSVPCQGRLATTIRGSAGRPVPLSGSGPGRQRRSLSALPTTVTELQAMASSQGGRDDVEHGEGDQHQVVAEGPGQVLADDAEGGPAQGDGVADAADVAVHRPPERRRSGTSVRPLVRSPRGGWSRPTTPEETCSVSPTTSTRPSSPGSADCACIGSPFCGAQHDHGDRPRGLGPVEVVAVAVDQ